MMHLGVQLLSLLGFCALALATDRQQEKVFGHRLPAGTTGCARLAGWVALGLALLVVVRGQGWAMGLVSYSGHTSLSAGLVFAVLILRDRVTAAR